MKLQIFYNIGAVLTVYVAFGLGAFIHAQTIVEDFDGGTVLPSTSFFTHDGSGSSVAFDDLTAEGLPQVTGFAGSGGGSIGDAAASLGLSSTGGVSGSQAVVLTLTNAATTNFAFAGITYPIGFAIGNPTDFIASVDVLAPAGVPLSLRVESPFGPDNNGFSLNFVGTGSYQTIGGVVGIDLVANAAGAFDFTSSDTSIIVASPIGGNVSVGVNQEILIDNFSFRSLAVPEPNTLPVLMGLGAVFTALRRLRSRT